MAAFKAGAAHPRRQKHRDMPPPGASAPAFAATAEPAFTQITSDLPPTYLQSDSSNERVLGMTCAVFPVYTLMRASILDFRPRLANRCKVLPVYALMRVSILDFKPKLANRCKLFPVYTLFRASILDFRPRLGNHCRIFPRNTLQRAVILDLRGSIWESLQENPQEWLWRCSDS